MIRYSEASCLLLKKSGVERTAPVLEVDPPPPLVPISLIGRIDERLCQYSHS
jgi:hypothetical protein